ncbi:serine hydrolase domain-containing protein [Algoriphagus marinus]|uniref:serine hydrolase domain-containing protein n=1 Tax=Algoriphagus marinus TaxID=1925762 RepID=UPI00094B9AA8|nr:serine hydrolase domain-containing protein [Algoriphagus marinus]
MAKKIKFFLFILIFWVAAFLAWEWWNSFPKVNLVKFAPEEGMKGKLDSILFQAINEYRLPGVSVALVKDGKVVYLNALGYQNLDTKEALTDTTSIPVASVSKIFTALTLANTALSIEKKTSDFLQDSLFKKFPPLSFHQLLEHKSGLEANRSFASLLLGKRNPSLNEWGIEFLEKMEFTQRGDQPMVYSDLNYDLLGFWLEKSREGEFQEQVSAQIFEPAGMDQSRFVKFDDWDSVAITGYQGTFLWKRLAEKQLKLQVYPSPSTGLLTSTQDMSLALIHLLRGDMGNFEEELAWLDDPENAKLLGFQKIRMLDSDWIGHFGGQAGYSSFFFLSKNENTGIFLFFNLKDPEEYRLELSKKLLTQLLQK